MPDTTDLTHLGVVGGGTMGSGIALVGLLADLRVSLVEPVDAVRDKARDYLHRHLDRKGKGDRVRRLALVADLESLHGADVVIECVPEDLRLKHEIFRDLDLVCSAPAILASNTSTLSVSAIAAAASCPERVAGMHFFNPAPVLPLVEVVRADRTDEATLQRLLDLARRMGKTPVVAGDTPGFIVNRVARPFYGEALRMLGEQVAPIEVIDRVVRGAGFRLGPFELIDMIGLDVNFTATKSMYERTFGEPRYRPHWIQERMVAEGRLGRKTGRGFYAYGDSPPVSAGGAGPEEKWQGSVAVSPGSWVPGLADLLAGAGVAQAEVKRANVGIVAAGRDEGIFDLVDRFDRELPLDAPLLVQCVDVAYSEVVSACGSSPRLIGLDGLFLATAGEAALVAGQDLPDPTRRAAESFLAALGRGAAWTRESPAMILPRLIATLANEAAFAVAEGVAEAETIDTAMRLGTNYPRGPIEWGGILGWRRVLEVLDTLRREFGEERYRAAPLLRRMAREQAGRADPRL